jgi:hypothetical protein
MPAISNSQPHGSDFSAGATGDYKQQHAHLEALYNYATFPLR